MSIESHKKSVPIRPCEAFENGKHPTPGVKTEPDFRTLFSLDHIGNSKLLFWPKYLSFEIQMIFDEITP